MSAQATEEKSMLDSVKWLVAIALLIGGIVGFNHFSEQPTYLRTLMVLGGLVLAIAVVMTTAKGKSLWQFIKESRTELRKVIWPTSNETVRTTIAVLFMVILLGLFLWGFDSLVVWVVDPIIG
ncbi:preprotein translocase subunit SecE [Kangiella sp. HZ709]|uniref:preprotein translocase subunit SecE n=1 Tax=Kangiella sp. HZ709 TaxID=2666328 RepID=UPI0012B0682D|nr:preprotein translocase subunit SecE [Kangiella sp. HZ709]MRX28727.1 preprotein translocase subunit SecE [Kangiella sp. HZ709]